MRIPTIVAVMTLGALGCGSRTTGVPPEAAAKAGDATPELRCPGGQPEKIKFAFAQSCANDGSVEFCIPDDDPSLRSALAAISSTIQCEPGGGRAGCLRSPGLLLCSYPTAYPAECTMQRGVMTTGAWSDMCEISALAQVTEIVPTILE